MNKVDVGKCMVCGAEVEIYKESNGHLGYFCTQCGNTVPVDDDAFYKKVNEWRKAQSVDER